MLSFPPFSLFFSSSLFLFLDVSNSRPPFPLTITFHHVINVLSFHTRPFYFFSPVEGADYALLRPVCCPMKTPLKCFPVKMFSIPPLLTLPIPQSHSLLFSSSLSPFLYLPAPAFFFPY